MENGKQMETLSLKKCGPLDYAGVKVNHKLSWSNSNQIHIF
jgi:hypothetical protein